MAAKASAKADYDYLFKILLVGESGVGKSSLLLRFTDDTFSPSFISTVGVDFRLKKINVNDRIVKLQIWDTAGQERFRTITSSFYRGAHGILLVFDVTNVNSFLKVKYWLEEIQSHAPEGTCVALVGNKIDLTAKRAVDQKEAEKFASQHGLKYIETSAKDSTRVNEAFKLLSMDIHDAVVSGKTKQPAHDSQQPLPEAQPQGCC